MTTTTLTKQDDLDLDLDFEFQLYASVKNGDFTMCRETTWSSTSGICNSGRTHTCRSVDKCQSCW